MARGADHAYRGVRITGGTGDDTIEDLPAFGANVSGGPGADTIATADFAMVGVMDGNAGADSITATAGFPEQINGGPGRDVINGGGGGDAIDCGPSIDRYAVFAGDAVTSCEVPFAP